MMTHSDDNDDGNNVNENRKTNQIVTTGMTHAAVCNGASGIAGVGVVIETKDTTTARTTTASTAPIASVSEEDRRVMDVISDILIQACMAMFVTSLGLRTVRTPFPPYTLHSTRQSLTAISCCFLICTTILSFLLIMNPIPSYIHQP